MLSETMTARHILVFQSNASYTLNPQIDKKKNKIKISRAVSGVIFHTFLIKTRIINPLMCYMTDPFSCSN